MKNFPDYLPFKSERKRQKFLDYYDARAKEWPVISETKYVETSFGKTFIRICGPTNAPYLVLLPSVNSSSLIWLYNVKGLSEYFRIFAVDNIYDVGRSVYSRPVKTAGDLVSWLDGLFTALNLGNNINLMGYSLGGWITSQFILHYPDRLQKAVLVCPVATILRIPGEWAWRGILSVIPNRRLIKKVMVNWAFQDLVKKTDPTSNKIIDDLMEDDIMALKCFKLKMPATPTVLKDEELHNIAVPTLFLVGEHEVLYSARDAVSRFNKIAPQIKTEIVPGASHDLPIVQSELVNKKVVEFLLKG